MISITNFDLIRLVILINRRLISRNYKQISEIETN